MHQGCFFTNLEYDKTSKRIGKTSKVSNAVNCQDECYKTEGCQRFRFYEPSGDCRLYEEVVKQEYKGNRLIVTGPRKCRYSQRAACAAFK